MEKIKPVKISVKNYDKTFGFSRLELNIKGDNVNHIIVNSLKRVVQTDIPIFAFNNFNITKNTSVFNNNFIKNQVRNIPVWGIENDLEEYVEDEEEEEEQFDEKMGLINDDIELEVEKNFDISALNKLNMYVDVQNKSNEIKVVTTNDCKFYYKEGMIDSPYKNAVQILKLQPNQEIKMSVQADIGKEEISGIYSATSACYFKESKDCKGECNDYDFIIESRGQIPESRILVLALKSLTKKLHNFLEAIPKNKGMEGTILVDGEDHTLGGIISYGLQKHSSVKFGGYNTPHPLNRQIKIHYKLDSGNLNTVMKDIVVYYEKLFDEIRSNIEKLVK